MPLLSLRNIEICFEEIHTKGLPGIDAQKIMAPLNRIDENYEVAPKQAKKSAVMLLIFEDCNELYLTLIERSKQGGVHAGQIALPGGKTEDIDSNHIETAIRETYEEVGVTIKHSQIIGELTPLYIPVSNFTVKPVVALANSRPNFSINRSEVEKLHILPLKKLIKSPIVIKKLKINNKLEDIPFFIQGETEIWGATAMIISELRELLGDCCF